MTLVARVPGFALVDSSIKLKDGLTTLLDGSVAVSLH